MPVISETYYHIYDGGEVGRKPPVVLIHGAGGTHLSWPADIRRIPGYRVFALDLPGHGKSGGRGRQSIGAYAEALVLWLEAVGLHSAIFVGHSMGGAIAITLALDFPQHVLGIGLIGTGARLQVAPDILESTISPTTYQNAVARIIAYSFSSFAPENLTALVAQRMMETRPSVLYSDFLACNAFDEIERISEIHCPTLVICGTEDKMTPSRYSQFLADRIPTEHLYLIPQAGHMVMLERPLEVATRLTDFFVEISY